MKTTKRTKKATPNNTIQYQSTQDPAFYIHHNKTHRSASEAFRDADYATPIWRSETDLEQLVSFLAGSMWGALIVFVPFVFVLTALHYVFK